MFMDFTGEELPRKRYVMRLTRHQVPGGWYVRVIFSDFASGAGVRTETALYLSDSDHSWQIEGFKWQMLKRDLAGGVHRTRVPGGWLLLGTAQGQGKAEDGRKLGYRTGSLVFIPDQAAEWECEVLEERDPYFGF